MHLIIDGHGDDPRLLQDRDLIYDLLDRYPAEIGMTKIAPPYVFRYIGCKPEDWGISGFVPIAESHISIHTFVERCLVNIDVFSCKDFDAHRIIRDLKDRLRLVTLEGNLLNRGLDNPELEQVAIPIAKLEGPQLSEIHRWRSLAPLNHSGLDPRPHKNGNMNIFGEKGSDICFHCDQQCKCCTLLEAPELTSFDISRIRAEVPLLGDTFFEEHPLHREGALKKMVPRKDGSCPLFRKVNSRGVCHPYEARPILCRLFPVDIYLFQGEYTWILYHDFCPLSQIAKQSLDDVLMKAEKEILPEMRADELALYAGNLVQQFSLFSNGHYKILRKARFADSYIYNGAKAYACT